MSHAKGGLSNRQKAAILLITLGKDEAAQIYKFLTEDEIEQLTLEIANLKKIDSDVKESILNEFYQVCVAQNYLTEGGVKYAKDVLEEALGSEKAVDLINKLTSSLQVRPFDFARKADPSQLLNFIQYEHPQTVALILSYLKPQQAAAILAELPQQKQVDVAKRIAMMDRTSPDVIKEVERVLEKKLSSTVTTDFATTGGIQGVVDILNSTDRGTEKYILDTLEDKEGELADEIKKRMFVFEDIANLDGRSIQKFLREVDNNDLAVALKGSTEEVTKVIFSNMSKRMQEMIKEDMDFMGPVRLRDVEESQQKIVAVIRKLEDAGEIVISRGGGDEIIV